MVDLFNEYIVKRKRTANDYLLLVGYILLALVITFASLLLLSVEFLASFFLLPMVGGWYLAYYLSGLQRIEYEYSVTNGEIDVDKITARRRRKRLITVHSKTFEFFAPYKKEYEREYSNKELTVIDACISLDSQGVYFAVFHHDGKKKILYFNPTERMIEDFERHVPKFCFHKQ